MLTKVYLCPADKKYGCTWEGSCEDIFEHFSQEHEDLLHFTRSVNVNLEEASENRLLLVDTEIYLLQTKIIEGNLNIYLRFLGPAWIASNLTYDIDLSANGMKVGKQDIEVNNGYFSVALECIQTSFGDVREISCQLVVSGEVTNLSNFNITPVLFNSFNNKHENLFEETDNMNGSNLNLNELFSSPNSSVEIRDKKKHSSDESNRATWYAVESDLPKERTNLVSRSRTFSSEDTKRSTIIKRQGSIRSLSSIAESDLDAELKCSICDCHLAPPIFLCLSEHNVCATCYRNNKTCQNCDKEITHERNLCLEEKSIDFAYTCVNKKNGCPKKLPHNEIEDHEVNCTFCHYVCPVAECGYSAGYKNMVSHLSLIHSSVKLFQSFIAIFQKYQELFIVNETMGIFYCSWSQEDNKFVWKAKFCGPKARKFFCELKFKGKNFKKPLLLAKREDYYFKEIDASELKELKLKAKNSILTITR